MGIAAVSTPLQPPLLQVKDPTWLSRAQAHTCVLSISPTSQVCPYTEPCPVEEAPVQ